ncbi:MAG: ATP-grasp domain-containing protein [Spirochaetaceae bacterium]|jgi:biotin carboxylase|nr:ATP-grasp domain-containing protein [Spirochaetaceae bacterium]
MPEQKSGGQKKRLLILGAGIMQGPAIRRAREMGLETIVIDGDPNAPLAAEADRFEPVDLKDIVKIEAFARCLQSEEAGLHGVMTAGTDFSASVAWAAEKLGLPGIPYDTALDASDKERMRSRFRDAGLPSPAFAVFRAPPPSAESVPFPFPAVVKPVDNMGGRGCRRADSFPELREAVESALQFSRSGRAIVEEYMEGPEFSVDAVVYRGEVTICGLADRHIFFPPYFIEMGHTMPAAVSQKDREALTGVFIQGIRALGIDNGAAKGDIKLTSRGPMIGEIAARLSGGYMSGWTYPYASGVNPAGGAICAALGREPEGLAPVRDWTSAERAFISIPGIVNSIEGIEKAKNIPYVKDLFFRAEPGRRVSFPENNVSKAGNVISAAPDRKTAVQAAENAARTILIRLDCPNAETGAFLAGPLTAGVFPPPAFTLDAALLKMLDTIPQTVPDTILDGNFFSAFMESGLTDYMGRSPQETFEAIRQLTGLSLQPDANLGGKDADLGREFWIALIRGGYQGAVYYIDYLINGKQCPGKERKLP